MLSSTEENEMPNDFSEFTFFNFIIFVFVGIFLWRFFSLTWLVPQFLEAKTAESHEMTRLLRLQVALEEIRVRRAEAQSPKRTSYDPRL